MVGGRGAPVLASSWRERILASVTPLEQGVAALDILGSRRLAPNPRRPSRTAAVLVPIMDTDEPAILLTQRARHLPQHGGQISFPGGAAEGADETAVATALREAHEEIGLSPGAVRPIGFLDRIDTISDYRVLPVVGLVAKALEWRLDVREVAEVFMLPLDVALDRSSYQLESFVLDGRRTRIPYLLWEERKVWGATAIMLFNLMRRVERAHGAERP